MTTWLILYSVKLWICDCCCLSIKICHSIFWEQRNEMEKSLRRSANRSHRKQTHKGTVSSLPHIQTTFMKIQARIFAALTISESLSERCVHKNLRNAEILLELHDVIHILFGFSQIKIIPIFNISLLNLKCLLGNLCHQDVESYPHLIIIQILFR